MRLTEEDAVRIGNTLRPLVQSDDFDFVIEALKAQYRNQYEFSEYNDSEAREIAFRRLAALEDLTTTMNTFIAIAEADALEVEFDSDNLF